MILFGMLVCTAITYSAVWNVPRMYAARTTIMQRHAAGAEGVPIYRDTGALQMDIDVRLSNLGNILTSQTVVERTANMLEELGLTVDAAKILQNTTVQPIKATEILAIEVRSPNPQESEDAANALVTEFVRFYGELVHGATSESKRFIASQLPKAKSDLERSQERLKEFKENNEVTSLTAQNSLMLQQATETQSSLSAADVGRMESAQRLKTLKEQWKGQPKMQVSSLATSQNPLWQTRVNELGRLETELVAQQQSRGSNHPAIKALKEQIENVKQQISKEEKERYILASTGESINPIWTNVLDRLISTNVENIAQTARSKALHVVLDEQMLELSALPAKEMELAQLELESRAAEATYTLLRTKLDEATIKEQETKSAGSIRVIDPARAHEVSQQKGYKVLIASLLSPLLMCALAFLLHYLDNSVRTPTEAEDILGLPISAVIPISRAHSLARHRQAEPLAISYQILADSLLRVSEETGCNTFIVASAEPAMGRTITAANLAIVLARDGLRVILIDGDLRRPRLHAVFGLPNKSGLTNILAGSAALEEVATPTKIQDLLLLTAGPQSNNPVRILRSPRMQELIEEVSASADFVIFDSPAGVAFADSAILASYVKNVILVHSAGAVPHGAEQQFRNQLEKAQANVVLALLNKADPEDSHGYFHYRRSYQPLHLADGRTAGREISAIPSDTKTES